MRQSSVIDINGIFVGAAVEQNHAFRFVSTDERLNSIDGSVFPTLRDVKSAASAAFFAARSINPSPHAPNHNNCLPFNN